MRSPHWCGHDMFSVEQIQRIHCFEGPKVKCYASCSYDSRDLTDEMDRFTLYQPHVRYSSSHSTKWRQNTIDSTIAYIARNVASQIARYK